MAVSGGVDIDSDDNGIIDDTPTQNSGTIHAFALAGELKASNVNVTLLSEIVYQYTKHLIGKIDTNDMLKAMAITTSKLFKNTTLSIEGYINKLNGFVPMIQKSRDELSFEYKNLIADNKSLNRLIYQNSDKVVDLITTLFGSVLTMSDERLIENRDSFQNKTFATYACYHIINRSKHIQR